MENHFELLVKTIDADSSLISEARFGNGISEQQLEELLQILAKIKNYNLKRELVDKNIVYLLVDIVPTLLLCGDLYKEENEIDYVEKVYQIHEAILECFTD